MSTVVIMFLVAGTSATTASLLVRLINHHVDNVIQQHVSAALDESDFDTHVSRALGIVSLPQQRVALDDAAVPRQ